MGVVTNNEIDEWGMSKALTIASHRALRQLSKQSMDVEHVLLDGHWNFIKREKYKVTTIVKGDDTSHAIAAASIVAKVYRDSYMSSRRVAGKYRPFCFESNKGYPAPVHIEALHEHGPTPLHRVSWDIFGSSENENQEQLF
jgi:ribonuclease HII